MFQSTPNGVLMGHVLGGLPSAGFQYRSIARQFYVRGNGETDPRNFIISGILGISCGIFRTRFNKATVPQVKYRMDSQTQVKGNETEQI